MVYRRDIDGLRALAVLPVILFHAGFDTFSGGFVGVDIFFVISGYLITSIILAEKEEGTFSLAGFYERRARRIMPALFFVMFTCILFAWLWLFSMHMEDFSRSLIAVPLFSSNILFWQESGYFDASTDLKPLVHTWSLAVEEQFYLLFPLLLMLTWKLGKRSTLLILLLIAFISLIAAQLSSANKSVAAFYLLPTRGWELLIGSFLALYFSMNEKSDFNKSLCQVCSTLGLFLIIYAIFAYDKHTPFPGIYTLAPTMGAALIILFSTQQTIVGRLLGYKHMVRVGLISYSAYLWHQPIFSLARHRNLDEPSNFLLGILTIASLIAAYISWKYIETPFRKKDLFTRRQIFVYSAAGSALFIAMGLAGHFEKGFQSRFEFKSLYEGDIGHPYFIRHMAERYFTCTPRSIAEEALITRNGFIRCMQSKQDNNVTIAVLGDSHAEHLFLGLAEKLNNKNIVFYIKDSYPLLDNPEFDTIFNHLLATDSIDTVLFTMHWVARINQIPHNTTLEHELLNTLNALIASGKSVYLLDDVPRFTFQPERCKFVQAEGREPLCDIEKVKILEYEKQYVPALNRIAETLPSVRLIALRDLFCTDAMCSMVQNGVLMYRDDNHLNILGSKYVSSNIIKRFPELNE